jgi:beta-xylosidase
MSGFLPSRAPTACRQFRCSRSRRHPATRVMATVVMFAVLAGPAKTDAAEIEPTAHGTPSAIAPGPVTDAPDEIDVPKRLSPGPIRKLQPLEPVSPADGRDAPDPFILSDRGHYVLYSTQVGWHNVPVAVSTNLRDWSPPIDALPGLPEWAAWGRTWAPGVARLGARYLLFFTALHHLAGRQCIGVATSGSATGPFTPAGPDPLVCQTQLGGSIDPYPFVDASGVAFLLWKSDGNAIGQASTLFAQPLTPDGLALAGEPVALLSSDADWEQPLIENPALVAAGGSYTLMYSGGLWESAGYAIGYATCDSPLGPCTKVTFDRPLLESAGDQAGPGGACLVTGPAGDQWLAYHAWTPGAIGYDASGARTLRFAALTWRVGQPVVSR